LTAEDFIARWQGVTASELATAQSFVIDLCALLGVDKPHPTPEQDYMFERPPQRSPRRRQRQRTPHRLLHVRLQEMTTPTLATHFIDTALATLRRKGMACIPHPNMPEPMRDHNVATVDDWIPWKPIASTVTDDDLRDIEKELSLPLPDLYRSFLRHKHHFDLWSPGVRFPAFPVDQWRKELRMLHTAFEPERTVGQGYLPFASEEFCDAGLICFDTHRMQDGDCPVVYWDFESVETDEEYRPLFSSASAMFRCLTVAAEQEFNIFYHYPEDPPESLPVRKHALRRFLEKDPQTAGSIARHYWTCWVVNPDR
jgi:hypothetical protein